MGISYFHSPNPSSPRQNYVLIANDNGALTRGYSRGFGREVTRSVVCSPLPHAAGSTTARDRITDNYLFIKAGLPPLTDVVERKQRELVRAMPGHEEDD